MAILVSGISQHMENGQIDVRKVDVHLSAPHGVQDTDDFSDYFVRRFGRKYVGLLTYPPYWKVELQFAEPFKGEEFAELYAVLAKDFPG